MRDLVVVVAVADVGENLLGLDVLAGHAWLLSFSDHTLTADPDQDGTLPLRVDLARHPYLDAEFGEGIRAGCVWDTGAGITVVDAGFAAAHPELFSGVGVLTGNDSSGQSRHVPHAVMAACTMGGVAMDASPAAIVDLSALAASAEYRVDMILGYPMLSQGDWLIDFPRRRWSVSRAASTG